jgi:2'-5' RNA ligase
MGLLAISYPDLKNGDLEWIQNIRSRFDPHYELVNPHFSLVFEVSDIKQDKFINHMRATCRNQSPIEFSLRSTTVTYSVGDEKYYLFLVPDEGNGEIIRLHDALYTGMLSKHLRLDIPYIPHITIGIFDEAGACKAAADEVNGERYEIWGKLDSVDIITLDGDNLESVQKISLG